MNLLEKGIYAICIAAYPDHENVLAKQVPKIIRATLNMKQLDITGKMQRIIDAAMIKDTIVNRILEEITTTKASINHSNIAKDTWARTIHETKTKLQGSENAR